MQSSIYQMLALGARAFFLFVALLIVLRAALYLLRAHRTRKKLLRSLPDAGMVGEMRDVDGDSAYPLPREGTLGSGRACDIRLRGLRRRQVGFAFVEGKGVLLTPCAHRSEVLLNGEPLGRGAYALHGALLRVGGYTLRIRLFAGLPVPHPAAFAEVRQPAFDEDLYPPVPVSTYEERYCPEQNLPVQEEPLFYSQRLSRIPAVDSLSPSENCSPVPEPPSAAPYAYTVNEEDLLQPVYPYQEATAEPEEAVFDTSFPLTQTDEASSVPYVRHRRRDRRRTL